MSRVSAPALLILVCGAPVSVSHCDHLDSRAAHTNRPSETLPIIEKTSWMSESCCGLSWGECPGASCRHSPPLSPSQVSNSDVSRMRPEEGRAGRAGYIVYWWYVRAEGRPSWRLLLLPRHIDSSPLLLDCYNPVSASVCRHVSTIELINWHKISPAPWLVLSRVHCSVVGAMARQISSLCRQ